MFICCNIFDNDIVNVFKGKIVIFSYDSFGTDTEERSVIPCFYPV